ncbi:hypothetical protein HHK36_025742 [Tetracentron sinense]|uniref:Uncharacterized protein n=1 Tax=Tetracentron sinense TaxID=13715 RepID=A0A835D5V0_TETSI|nr:hypothetical protein HHK36_025742 [Tetracentron sinense]
MVADHKRMEDISDKSGENELEYSVSIKILADSIRENLNPLLPLSYESCIYRVPKVLRRVSESAYTPKLVSLGPFHRDNEILGKMNVHKQKYLKTYLDWYPEIKLESCLESLRGIEGRARQCYAEFINLNSFQFVEMMLLDGFFIIVFLIKFYSPERRGSDPIFDTMWMSWVIEHDMILLENQLPFFVLEHLFNLAPVSRQDDTYPDLFDMTIQVFQGLVEKNTTPNIIDRSEVKHILDLLRCCCIPLSPSESPQVDRTSKGRYSVAELHNAGVKFKAGVSGSSCLLDAKFAGGVLEIQPLCIEDRTEPFFRNLIAFEQFHYPNQAYVTSYAVFLDNLINTPKDADLLIHHDIIENCLGDHKEATHSIKNLSKAILADGSYFSRDYAKLDAYCNKRRHKWMTSLRRTYLHSPWAIISFIATVFLIILTLMQAICSIISLYS